MKNTKLSVGLIACLLSVAGLAGCDATRVKSSKDGVLLTYYVDGEKHSIDGAEILENSYDDSSKYQSIFDVIYSVLVKNYFNREATVYYYGTDENHERVIGKGQMGNPEDVAHGSEGSIYGKANQKVDDDIETAHTNADANNTRYKKELEAILESKGVKTVEELKEKYVEEIQKETFEKNFYTYYMEDLKLGAGATKLKNDDEANAKALELRDFWPGYFDDQMPYHVSHILVKLEDSSGTNYADGTISKANANRLYDVVNALATSDDSFSTIAKQYSEDTGSAKVSGDLGIMDTSTSFVNEFKLGVYAYENYYAKVTTEEDPADTKGTNIDALNFDENYAAAVDKSFGDDVINGVPTIPSKVFEWLRDAADVDKDANKEEVLDNAASLYPRNIIYNKYLNRHSVAFITGTAMAQADADAAKDGSHGYVTYPTTSKLSALGGVLSVKVAGEWRPILCVRAGSDYQGIHFIVINRSPFEKEATAKNGNVNQSDYYTTFYPDQKLFPEVNGKTYVNFSSKDSDVTATKKRAEELASKLKSFDSDRLSKYIFKKYLAEEKVQINCGVTIKDKDGNDVDKLAYRLNKWIDTSVEKAAEQREETWDKTWTEYIDTLSRQGSERSKLIPQACRLVYTRANSSKSVNELLADSELALEDNEIAQIKADIKAYLPAKGAAETDEDYQARLDDYYAKAVTSWFKTKGGLCNDGKEHIIQ